MVDQEVENTLREIRERVRAAAPVAAHAPQTLTPAAVESPLATQAALTTTPPEAGGAADALSRMEAGLATTGRAWSRLPPVLSYRGGLLARLELWLKRLVKRALHWFTWEQVNFNSATHHALRDALSALEVHEQLLARTRAEVEALRAAQARAEAEARAERERREADAAASAALLSEQNARLSEQDARLSEQNMRLSEQDARLAEQNARLAAAETRLSAAAARLGDALAAGLSELRDELTRQGEARNALAESFRAEQDALTQALRSGQESHVAALQTELRERVEHLLEEQRVCFRQLSLETTETAVMHDRARRLLEARLEQLEQNRER